MVDRDPLPAWGQGRVTLLGDAAHPMYPVGANGASQAIVDARVLARELATTADPGRALAAYEATRRVATTAVVLANREMSRAGHGATRRDRPDRLGSDIAAVTDTYRSATGSDVDTLNNRASLSPDHRAVPSGGCA
jgi:2-polyprenyl-6-methoxyphenol hydroxylase-like FAD-dependent oxidoreductase